jgi:3-demethylubiquinone-9 3-methyltransferase
MQLSRRLSDAGMQQKELNRSTAQARTRRKAWSQTRQALSNMSRVEHGKLDLLDPTSIDAFASAFLASGEKSRCGWLKDKFGLSWQIIPTALGKLMSDPNPKKSKAVLNAMLKMDKIVIKGSQEAYDHA